MRKFVITLLILSPAIFAQQFFDESVRCQEVEHNCSDTPKTFHNDEPPVFQWLEELDEAPAPGEEDEEESA